jgi:hypothetical protein
MVNILNESFCGLPTPSVCVHVNSNGHVYASLSFEQISAYDPNDSVRNCICVVLANLYIASQANCAY